MLTLSCPDPRYGSRPSLRSAHAAGFRWQQTGAGKYFRGVVRSPIRAHTSGLAQADPAALMAQVFRWIWRSPDVQGRSCSPTAATMRPNRGGRGAEQLPRPDPPGACARLSPQEHVSPSALLRALIGGERSRPARLQAGERLKAAQPRLYAAPSDGARPALAEEEDIEA